jgi:TrbL/VirB6 plasmid conjugal transfer protein
MHKLIPVFVVALLGLMAPELAFAADTFPLPNAYTKIDQFTADLDANINRALTSGAVRQAVNAMFLAMAVGLFVFKFVGYAMRGFDVMDIIELMLSILFVFVLLNSYAVIFPAIRDGALSLGDAVSSGIMGSRPGQGFARSMLSRFAEMTFTPKCNGVWECLGGSILALIATLLGWTAVIVLGIVAVLVDVWCSWGFAIAYAVGFVMIPFMLYERLSFLFDGWLKFFFGMGVYAILAKVNLALVFKAMQLMLGSSGAVNSLGSGAFERPIEGFVDIAGLLVFVVVGIFALCATGRFSQAIVMGAGGGGIGGMVQSAAKTAAKAATGGTGAAAGAVKK